MHRTYIFPYRYLIALASFFLNFYLFMIVTEREREREVETQAEGEAGSMHREPDVGFDSGSPGSRPGPKTGAKPLRHPGIPLASFLKKISIFTELLCAFVKNRLTAQRSISESSILGS